MSAVKRKNAPSNDSFMRSKKTDNSDARPSKKARQEAPDAKADRPNVPQKLTQNSKIQKPKEEEVAFPRGGASVLTPLEHKQIQIEATRDVLFEQENAAKSKEPSKKSKSKKKGKNTVEEADPEDAIKIESLSYKRILPGSMVLGQVSRINAHDVTLTLPNNLVGYVPITAISDKFTSRVEALLAEEDSEEDDAEDDEEKSKDDVDLESMFTVGQYLRAYVVSTHDEPSSGVGSGKRRIELSLHPELTNSGLSSNELVVNNIFMASVVSVEDHGLVMDLGLKDKSIKGFMSSKEVGFDVNAAEVPEGAVFMCIITGLSSNGKIVKLSADKQKLGNLKKTNFLASAPTIDAFLPGTAAEVLISDVTNKGIIGKVMGSLDVTADLLHSGIGQGGKELEKRLKIGSKIKCRIVCTFPNSEPRKLGVSLLEHVLTLTPKQVPNEGQKVDPLSVLPLSKIIEEATVCKVVPSLGLFVDVGVKGVSGFVHISRVQDTKIESLGENEGPYKLDSVHRGRVVGYNSVDGIYLLSLEKKVLEQPFLRVEDVEVGAIVKGTVEKLIVNKSGIGGLLVNIADGISGLVPETHLADIQLLHPEKKFKPGTSVKARVLSVDPEKRQIRLTLKKTLVNAEAAPFKSYAEISPGMQSPGTIVNIVNSGAVIQFYGPVRGFLPVSQMSEAFIEDPRQHFRNGQVVNVNVLDVDPESGRMTVSCKDPSAFGPEQKKALESLKIGGLVSAKVTEKSSGDISLELTGSNLRATLPVGHLTDGSETKNTSALKTIRVGQTLNDLLVLEKRENQRVIILTKKPSLLKAAKSQTLIRDFGDVKENRVVHGFVQNITLSSVFVGFGGSVTGLLPKAKLSDEALSLPDFGLRRLQSLTVKVISVDHDLRRFVLSARDVNVSASESEVQQPQASSAGPGLAAVKPVDAAISSTADLAPGKLTSAKITSVKETQINVQLAENISGRVDVSQVFDKWEDIKDRKHPLQKFSKDQVIQVRVLGVHDARNHRFLPISHRAGKNVVFELSAKPSDLEDADRPVLSLDKLKVDSEWVAFVNNVGEDCLWVNLGPNVRGRIAALDVTDDVSLLQRLEESFPVGSALRVRVKGVDIMNNKLDLTARRATTTAKITLESLTKGSVLPGKVTKATERQILVQLTPEIAGAVNLPDFSDDFDKVDTTKYNKNDIVRVCITDIDVPNKKVRLSTRPSRVLNSSLPVTDPEVLSLSQLNKNDVVRGFVKQVSDKGLFIHLGGDVTAYVRISDISDSYIKEWKEKFEVGQLVKGKVILVDTATNHLQLSLKASVLDKNYVAPLTFNDLEVGQIVTGKVRKVEDFGVFIVIDNSQNVSGLCHMSQMSEKRVNNVKELYGEGDAVKAKVLRLDTEKRRINLGMKASYFGDAGESDEESEDDDADGMEGVVLEGAESSDEEDDEDGGVDLDDAESSDEDAAEEEDQDSDEEMEDAPAPASTAPGLSTGGFNWSGDIDEASDGNSSAEEDLESALTSKKEKKRKRKPEIKIDKTGDLDINGPQTSSDFERLLLGQPDSSQLWIEYMAYYLKLGEIPQARDIAERAIKTINIREETDKMNMWIALLNLENAYGTDETVDAVFKRACQYNDDQEIHERLASIYIQSAKHDKADTLFLAMTKKYSQSPNVWYNYFHFLMTSGNDVARARTELSRALQALPAHEHLPLTLKFAALEFNTEAGSAERGRTIFEGLLDAMPKRLDIWNQLLDLEIKHGEKDNVRRLFERVAKKSDVKAKGMLAWFKRWREWEQKQGDKKRVEMVEARAKAWVEEKKGKSGDE